MIGAADKVAQNNWLGAWKVGDNHINNMLEEKGPHKGTKGKKFTITTREEYWSQFDAKQHDPVQHDPEQQDQTDFAQWAD